MIPGVGEPFAREPYVQLATPTSMVIVWRTEGPITPVVRFGLKVNNLDRALGATSMVVRLALTTNKVALAKIAETNVNLLRMPSLNHQCEITSGVLQDECAAILQSFFQTQRTRKTGG